ncbi:hypothetical protein C6P45_003316 [Maudiozyma exigua]|uniref:Uncharacterized protein n=1 Tax=Maudiozyma exigua TaxID=34358 RepID=A0A9P6WCG1_MAUEX|nr:hypothetical protein C6P45_003316 [Kazachstania exigua]
MGIPIELYTSNTLQYINNVNNINIPPIQPLNDDIRQKIYDKMLCSNSNQIFVNNNTDIQMNCKIELIKSLKLCNRRNENLKFQTCNNGNCTIIYDMDWIKPISIIINNVIKKIDLINDIKNLFDLKFGIIDIQSYIPKHTTELNFSIILQNNTIIVMNYNMITGNTIENECFTFSLPHRVTNTEKIIKIFLEFLPFYLILITNQQVLIYDTLNHTLLSLDIIPKELLNKKYDYFINFPQLLITNNRNRFWKIDNFLEVPQLEIKKFNLKPILRDNESVVKVLITDLSYFTMETNQRIITVNTVITEYIDFKILLVKNCKDTIILYSNDMKQIILIERNLYSLSLSLLNWSIQCNKYILVSYNDLQNNLLSNNNELTSSRHIHHAFFDSYHNMVTVFHSYNIIADTFTINYDRCIS